MKKIIAMILSLCLLCSVIALAENETTFNQNSTNGGTTTLSYTITVNDGYTVTIPTTVEFAQRGQYEYQSQLTIAVAKDSGYNAGDKTLNVYVDKVSGYLTNNKNAEAKIPYALYTSPSATTPLTAGDPVLSVGFTNMAFNGTPQANIFAKFSIQDLQLVSGTYSDILTFTASFGNVSVNDWGNGGDLGGGEAEEG